MSHWQRVVLMTKFIAVIFVFIVFITRVLGPVFNVAEDMTIAQPGSQFYTVYAFFSEISFLLIVPVILVGVLLYLVFGPAQEELQKERRRRGL